MLLSLSIGMCAQTQPDSTAAAKSDNSTTMLGTYYADRFVGRHTSNGEIFRQNQYTAAHKSIPFGTYLLVTYPLTGQSVVVRVNDRCPKSNILDMTKISVHALGIRGSGKVSVTTLDPAVGYMLWIHQDTLAMTTAEYLAYRDRSKTKRISPYPHAARDSEEASVTLTQAVPKKSGTPTAQPQQQTPAARDTLPTQVTAPLVLPETPIPATKPADTVATTPPKGPLYDLELCTVGSTYAARLEQNRLPQEMQDKLLLESNKQNREIRLVLALADTRSHVVRTQAELIDLFPESCLILHEK